MICEEKGNLILKWTGKNKNILWTISPKSFEAIKKVPSQGWEVP